jgi:hypothetical protein
MPVLTAQRSTPHVLAGGGTSVEAAAADVGVRAAVMVVLSGSVVETAVVDIGLSTGGAWVVAGVAVGGEEVQEAPRTRHSSRTLGGGRSLRTPGA